MRITNDSLRFSATDLSNNLACPQISLLDRQVARGALGRPRTYDDPMREVLQKRGQEHEADYLEKLRMTYGADSVVTIGAADTLEEPDSSSSAADRTIEAMTNGARVIYQPLLENKRWVGRPDFLVRIEPSADYTIESHPPMSKFGEYWYDVVDAKLARSAKGGAVLQVLLYAHLLEEIQGCPPRHVSLALGGPEGRLEEFRTAEFQAYFDMVRRRFERTMLSDSAGPVAVPDPQTRCELCDWFDRCNRERRDVDHLCFVSGISVRQQRELVANGVETLEDLSRLTLEENPGIGNLKGHSLWRIREQARIQREGRDAESLLYEFLPHEVDAGFEDDSSQDSESNITNSMLSGLAGLPEPSPGDIFFDIEGDPYAANHGLEYLFGYATGDGSYTALWALDREGERKAFEEFLDFVAVQREKYPGMHIYHYAPYEPSALKRLMGLHGTRERDVDELLRSGTMIDLYRVVRQGLRASVESYSIKHIEPFYNFTRDIELRDANHALANFHAWLELGGDGAEQRALLQKIEAYNRDDCFSTVKLRVWLESVRSEYEAEMETSLPRPATGTAEYSEEREEENAEVAELIKALTEGVPTDEEERSSEQHGRWLLAHVLEFHRREEKSYWWNYFRILGLVLEEQIEEPEVIAGLTFEGEVGKVKRSVIMRYSFPTQEFDEIQVGKRVLDSRTGGGAGEVLSVDRDRGLLELKCGPSLIAGAGEVTGIMSMSNVNQKALVESIRRLARRVVDHGGLNDYQEGAIVDLLLRNRPRIGQQPNEPIVRQGEEVIDAARRIISELKGTVVPIQGPPGAGKTYTGARMILTALKQGKRVGVTALSHKAITNLMAAVCEAADEENQQIAAIQINGSGEVCDDPRVVHGRSIKKDKLAEDIRSGSCTLVAGTAWLWSVPEMQGVLDVLFIDEAGQYSLANTLAVTPSARNLVLLGDQQQLVQPLQGSHPPGSDASALMHLLDGASAVPPDRGLFLERTYRLHPDICRFTSEMFYAGRLQPVDATARQKLQITTDLPETGLCYRPVEHDGNTTESPEEIEVVAELVEMLCSTGNSWVDQEGRSHSITLDDVLVVAPYNVQVEALIRRLPENARVGTVDKFQGQEAAVVICSMTTSTMELAPRGTSFLFSPNRLNVATSRARALAILVSSPQLWQGECRSPQDMKRVNPFCEISRFEI